MYDFEKHLAGTDPLEIVAAIGEIYKLDGEVEFVIPALIRLLPDQRSGIRAAVPVPPEASSVSGHASKALVHIGKPAVPYLVGALESETSETRKIAARTLGRIRPFAADTASLLLRMCDDPESDVRREAVRTLVKIGVRPHLALPTLIQMITKEPDEWVRYEVTRALGELDETGHAVVTTLILALGDVSPDVRGMAALMLGQYGRNAKAAIPHLIESLADSEMRWESHTPDSAGERPVYNAVADALTALVEASPDRTSEIMNALKAHGNAQVRSGAALVLIRTSPHKAEALAVLKEILEESPEAVEKALEALEELKADGRDAERLVEGFLQHDDRVVRFRAIRTLGAIAGESGISALMEVMHEEDDVIRLSAAKALGNLGPSAAMAVPVLTEAVDSRHTHGDFFLCDWAVEALGKIGPAAKASLPTLLDVLQDTEAPENFREVAATAIGEIAPRDPIAMDSLQTVLHDEANRYRHTLRSAVAAAIGRAGPAGETAVPSLTAIVANESEWDEVRASAAKSLGQIGGGDTEVISALSQVLREERDMILDRRLRQEAAWALGILRAEAALELLKETSADKKEYESVRGTAAEAVRRIQLPE